MEQAQGTAGLGLIAQLRALADLGLRSVNTRLRLAQAELQAEKDRLFAQLIWMMAAVILGVCCLFLGVVGLIQMAPESWRPSIMVGTGLAGMAGCWAIGWRVRRARIADPHILAETLDVLEEDAKALTPSSTPHSSPQESSHEPSPNRA
ncbi:MAG: phage holin family protein [Aquabacterium sp.]